MGRQPTPRQLRTAPLTSLTTQPTLPPRDDTRLREMLPICSSCICASKDLACLAWANAITSEKSGFIECSQLSSFVVVCTPVDWWWWHSYRSWKHYSSIPNTSLLKPSSVSNIQQLIYRRRAQALTHSRGHYLHHRQRQLCIVVTCIRHWALVLSFIHAISIFPLGFLDHPRLH